MTAEIIFDDELENTFDDVASVQYEYIYNLIRSEDWFRSGNLSFLEYLLIKELQCLNEIDCEKLNVEIQTRLVLISIELDYFCDEINNGYEEGLDIYLDLLNEERELEDREFFEKEITEYCKTIVK